MQLTGWEAKHLSHAETNDEISSLSKIVCG
jgi:hypothetical protein